MDRTYISELPRHIGESVTLRGWVVTTRSSGKIAFLVVRDGSGTVQGVVASGYTDLIGLVYRRSPGSIDPFAWVETYGLVRA